MVHFLRRLSRIAIIIPAMPILFATLAASPACAGPQDMLALMQKITALAKAGQYPEAVALARRLESDAEAASGRQSPLTATTLVVLGQVLQTSGNITEAESVLRRALAIRQKTQGPGHPDVAAVLATLGTIELGQNRLNDAERDTSRALVIDEAALGPDHLNTALARMQLGNVRYRQMREADALDLFKRALDVFRKNPGPADIMVPVVLNNIAEIEQAQGQLQAADQQFLEALRLQEAQHGKDSLYVTATINNLGELRRAQGKLADAEQLARRALAIREKSLGPNHPDVAASLNNLAIVFSREGRASEAEALLLRALDIQEKTYGPDHPNVATALNNLADAMAHEGKKGDAETLFRRSLAIREKSLGPAHVDVAVALDNLVTLLGDADRYAEAEPLARRSLAIRQTALGASHPLVANSLNNLAVILDSTGRPNEAEPLLIRALDIRTRALGETHPDVANSLSNLGSHYLDAEDWQKAEDIFVRATDILKNRQRVGAQPESRDLKLHEDANPFPGLIVAAYHLAQAPGQDRQALQARAFEAAQWIGDEQTSRAISGMSARIAAGDGELAARVRQRQDLSQQAQAIDGRLIALMSQPGAGRDPQVEATLRAQAAAIESRSKELDVAIAARFPGYAALIGRSSVSITDVQKQLGAREALVLFTTTARFTFVWAITRTDVIWHAAPTGEKQLAETVGALRCGLDAEAWFDAKPSCAQSLGLKSAPAPGAPLPFDQARAFALYDALLGPIAAKVEGDQLVLVPSGPLATLPFEVLLTDKPTSGDLANAPWLVKRFATSVLPSVSSLVALRQVAKASTASKPFAGFGNPLLMGDGRDPQEAERARLARVYRSCDQTNMQTAQLAERGARAIATLAGAAADVEQLRHQMPLPETAQELCAVAASFAPDKGDVFLADEATETNIKSLSDSGRLAQYRMLHFATHGALAGQVHGSIQPGLILTPPAVATPADDGYLSSSEIAGLKLDADWVVLSACNTAGGETANSEAFSGLARAFFFAGARALLVTHWPVGSQAAVAITTGTVAAMNAHPGIGRAEALRQSLLALIAKGGANAQPSSWAPFVLVGNSDGG